MSLFAIIVLAIVLSVDSFAASVSTGICIKKIKLGESTKIATYMAVFQGLLPVVGWLVGRSFQKLISDYDHWVAFILLLAIGGKMIYESFNSDESKGCFCPSKSLVLAGMALATSIDALIVGVGIGLLGESVWFPAIVIGFTTFIFSFTGVYIGHHLGHRLNFKLEIIGGVVLIGLGVKILLEHTLLA